CTMGFYYAMDYW
nr:immunoglobulin heavy chain junction region [Mus musculus]NSM05524.1 immunoglobulin heavy chain junction region [Mus musculus]